MPAGCDQKSSWEFVTARPAEGGAAQNRGIANQLLMQIKRAQSQQHRVDMNCLWTVVNKYIQVGKRMPAGCDHKSS